MNEPEILLNETLKTIHFLELEQQELRHKLYDVQNKLMSKHATKNDCLKALGVTS